MHHDTEVASFHLSDWPEPVPEVTIAPDAIRAGLTEALVLNFTAFKDWIKTMKDNLILQTSQSGHTFHRHPWTLRRVAIHTVTFAGPRISFMLIEAKLHRAAEEPHELNRVVFLRGGSTAVLMILRTRHSPNERYVIMTEQPRAGAASLAFLEIPAGKLDDSPEVKGKVLEQIKDETGFTVQKDELIDLTELALRRTVTPDAVRPAMYVSPANMDEFIQLFVWEKVLDRQEIEELKGKLAGLRRHPKMITLVICHYEEIWRKAARDAKTLAAWALYEGLDREGEIQKELSRIRMGRIE